MPRYVVARLAEHGGLMTVAEYSEMAHSVERKGLENASLDELRTVAYYHQRALKNSMSAVLPSDASMIAIHQVIEVMRRKLSE